MTNKMNLPNFDSISQAHDRIKPFIHKTPVLESSYLNNLLECSIYFKCENFQKVGAFKFRGALNAVLSNEKDTLKKGVTTHSSGNHAQALALAANLSGTKATIIMPQDASKSKIEAVKAYGADIIFCEPNLISREETCQKFIDKSGALFIHPYNDHSVISGQGTTAKEFIEEVPYMEMIVTPVGGGGLLSGTAIAAKSMTPSIRVFAGEPYGAGDACRSFYAGQLIQITNPNTIADGLRTSLGTITFSIIIQIVDSILTASDETIIAAMRLIWERMKIVVEPSAAVPLAAIMENKDIFKNKKVGVILSGGNADLDNLPWIKKT